MSWIVLRRKAWPAWIGSSLVDNPQPKLKFLSLTLDGDFDEEDGDVILEGLNHEFREISRKNVLEELEVRIKVNLDTRNGPLWDWTAWAADFDKILTRAGAFPALRKVAIRLTWFILDIPCAYLGSSPGGLTEEHFPRLLKSTTIVFCLSDSCDNYF